MMKRWYYLGLIALVLLSVAGCNKKNDRQRAISVAGTACIYVEPDEATISFTLYSKDRILIEAKKKNDAMLQRFQNILKDFSIDQNNLSLQHSTVEPINRYDHQIDERILHGYCIQQHISVKIKDITQYEAFVTALLDAGIDRINHTEFANSELKKHRDDARKKAVEAAIDKASLLCQTAAGVHKTVQLGRVLEIREAGMQYRYSTTSAMSQVNYERAAPDALISSGLVPIGSIPIEATIEMVFSLE